jgi:MoxR-like ATPase
MSEQHNLRLSRLDDDTVISVPDKDSTYVESELSKYLNKIIASDMFLPIYIVGEKGFGKTFEVEQTCARLNRKLARIPISIETDQFDLFGGTELIGGNTVNRDGPVIKAMREGAILLLDEVDRGSNKLICLQSVLEGKPYFNKNTGEVIYPAKGFNIIGTANTRGRGSIDGRYLAQILDEAFLDRFLVILEHSVPSPDKEQKILHNIMESVEIMDASFIENLIKWASQIRLSFKTGAYEETISTRKLVSICKIYSIFNNKLEAIKLSMNNMEDETMKRSILDLYTSIDADAKETDPYKAFINDTNENGEIVWKPKVAKMK